MVRHALQITGIAFREQKIGETKLRGAPVSSSHQVGSDVNPGDIRTQLRRLPAWLKPQR